ncbi:MAG TPA: CHAT domain-containing protein [Chloroflexia bacterium]|nr:CHAT domain-containing protein [Chloroflexia bacterium]
MSSGGSSFGAQSSVLRFTQSVDSDGKGQVELTYRGPGQLRPSAISQFPFSFDLSKEEQEDLRWYFEDYLQHPIDPTPKIAARIEQWMERKGEELFTKLFKANDATILFWSAIRHDLKNMRIEVSSGAYEAASIPWELVRDPQTGTLPALSAAAFTRTHSSPVSSPQLPSASSSPIRILLVICRPGKEQDVPFRSVASRLVKSLTDDARAHFILDVLRPPTYENLSKTLRLAHKSGKPYHVVHFDGHGAFLDVSELLDSLQGNTQEEQEAVKEELKRAGVEIFDPRRYSPQAMFPYAPVKGQRGYLVFENPNEIHNIRFVDGPRLGALLKETEVPVLVLNACRSAHAEAPTSPSQVVEGTEAASIAGDQTRVRAYGSFAQEVVDAGVAGVIAMRYNVYAVTAAQFVADLYSALLQGYTLGEAVQEGRRQLDEKPMREIAYDPVRLQDWSVPVVYEATPISLFPRQQGDDQIKITIRDANATPARGDIDSKLPKRPDVGFYGRDETLLALDRAFDGHHVVLLHAYAGSGKTTTAAEFARWYSLTGGIEGPVLFTSFEQPLSLPRTLDTFGRVFAPSLEQAQISWLALDDNQRREVALDVMRQVPLLWIWDNVEQVAGFPSGTPSILSAEEQKELAGFLRDAKETKAKFLLTSRREEQGWLGNLPIRVEIPPMPMLERLELAKALAAKYGKRLDDVEDWRPLLRYTWGNPLTITVVVGHALRNGLSKKAQIETYVARLRAGEEAFEDEESEGRTKSLGASLDYGFSNAFTEEERGQVALLHLFQGFVDVDTLRVIGNPMADWSVPTVRGLTREAGIALLDRAAEVGLLTDLGNGFYTVHPALTWYFKGLFHHYYVHNPILPTRAYVLAMGDLGNYYSEKFAEGNQDMLGTLVAEEDNLLHARQLARANGWWSAVISTMQGLRVLYDYMGRRAEWKRLVEEFVPDFVDSITDRPIAGREEEWNIFIEYQVRLTRQSRQWSAAERLQETHVKWNRERASALATLPVEELDAAQRNTIRTLAVSLTELGQILREQGNPECVQTYEEAYELSLRMKDKLGAAITAFNLGHTYKNIPTLRDLDQAEHWYNLSLELSEDQDRLVCGRCHGQLGTIAFERLKEAINAGQPDEELSSLLNAAQQGYIQALDLLPASAVQDAAITYNQLGLIYYVAGEFDRALPYWRQAIRYYEAAADLYSASETRFNIALGLMQDRRFDEALLYAQAALRNVSEASEAADWMQKIQELIAHMENLQEGG